MIATILAGILLTLALQTDEAAREPWSEIGRTAEVVFMPPQDRTGTLDGRTLVVRWYEDWENAPGEFETRNVSVEGNRVAIEAAETTDSIVVIAAEDQKDEIVKEAVGNAIWVQNLAKKPEFWLPLPQIPDDEKQFWQFTEALGKPLLGAVVETWLSDYRGPRIRLSRTTLDPEGRLARRTVTGDLRSIFFVVSHPDYGCGAVREPYESDRKVIAPLVRRGTVAAERAIHGRVMDPNGAPVAGATIDCSQIRTLGDGLINGLDAAYKGITDANGAFSFYLPNRRSRDDRGELIPPRSQYYVRIVAPPKLGLLPYVDPIENGREARVVLERGDRLRRLRFEDPNGEITDRAKLETIAVSLRRPGRFVLTLHYDDWKQGAPLIPGTYEASMRGTHEELRFEPVELTRDSPEEVVFKLPAGVTYYGRVVHGITGLPMPGAFVLAMGGNCADMRLSDLTAEQWDTLHRLGSDPSRDDAGLALLGKIYSFVKLVRTDAAGCYGIALKPDEAFYGFVAFERDHLAVMRRKHALKPDADRFAEVPTIRLFPAATVFVETAIEKEHASIMPKWEIDEKSRPAWVEELLGLDNGRESSLEYKDWLKPNARQPVNVPAGVGLRLRLEMPYDEEFCPILIPQTICLNQGETADLGRVTFEPALPVQVKIVDSTGQAVEGIPVRTMQLRDDGMTHWGVPHNTDEQGVARFHVVPHSSGSFGVFHRTDDGVYLKETVDYQIGGSEEAGRELILRLSDEMLGFLLQ